MVQLPGVGGTTVRPRDTHPGPSWQSAMLPIQQLPAGLQSFAPAGHHCHTAQAESAQHAFVHSSALDAVYATRRNVSRRETPTLPLAHRLRQPQALLVGHVHRESGRSQRYYISRKQSQFKATQMHSGV
jgi:hypothetical protein